MSQGYFCCVTHVVEKQMAEKCGYGILYVFIDRRVFRISGVVTNAVIRDCTCIIEDGDGGLQ